jgi:hypothetical protein
VLGYISLMSTIKGASSLNLGESAADRRWSILGGWIPWDRESHGICIYTSLPFFCLCLRRSPGASEQAGIWVGRLEELQT